MCHVKIVSKVLVLALLLTGAAATAAPARAAARATDSRPVVLRAWTWLEAALLAVLPAPLTAKAVQQSQGLDRGGCIDSMGLDRGVCIDPIGVNAAVCIDSNLDRGGCIDPMGGQ